MGKAVLASQFAAGLLPEIKAKVAGSEGDLDALLSKARFEEAKLQELAVGRQQSRKPPHPPVPHPAEKQSSVPGRPAAVSGSQMTPQIQCYGCGVYGHYRNKCSAKGKGLPAEVTEQGWTSGNPWEGPAGWLTSPWRGQGLRGLMENRVMV